MAKVKAYDMKEMVERETKGKSTPRENKLVIIELENCIIVIDTEAVHSVYRVPEDTHEVQLHPLNGNNMALIPSSVAEVPISYITEHAKFREVELTDFVRHFSNRIENNYTELLRTLKKAGLNIEDYNRSINNA